MLINLIRCIKSRFLTFKINAFFCFNKAVKDTELNHSDFFYLTNDIVKSFDPAINDTNLPDFNADEKGVIANCLTRSIFNEISNLFFITKITTDIESA